MARRELGRTNDARQDFEKALGIEPGNKSIKEELAKLPATKAVPSAAPSAAQPTIADKGKGKATPSSEPTRKQKVDWPKPVAGKGKEKATASAPVSTSSAPERRRLPITVVDGSYDAKKDSVSVSSPPPTTAAASLPAITPSKAEAPTVTLATASQKAASEEPAVMTQPAISTKSSTPSKTPLAPLKLACPRTNMEFERDWKTCRVRGRETLYQYFKGIPPKNYSSLFRSSLESDQFEEILGLLDTFYAERDSQEDILAVLQGLSQVRRIDMLVMFLGSRETQALQRIFRRLQECTDGVQLQKLAKIYAVKI
ncbi:hypothetical protein BCR43DRAFT_20543 [Syncephalastrum racemosum]|uniref:RNA polymerase II-associated protein 3 n=1 Tax=Syncephalastrum racemosum TaxID=13706 RepID=A0A1X2HT01_SYNRA|nr:hypothetical protein BCR43DRAFT_20543 [Syncephalastrum racemosum]